MTWTTRKPRGWPGCNCAGGREGGAEISSSSTNYCNWWWHQSPCPYGRTDARRAGLVAAVFVVFFVSWVCLLARGQSAGGHCSVHPLVRSVCLLLIVSFFASKTIFPPHPYFFIYVSTAEMAMTWTIRRPRSSRVPAKEDLPIRNLKVQWNFARRY